MQNKFVLLVSQRLSQLHYNMFANDFRIWHNIIKRDDIMTNSLMQFRTDDAFRIKAVNIKMGQGRQ